jgi:TM2 domain-containing membrane protein YozV
MKNITISTDEEKDKTTAYLLWCAGLFGFTGLHRFYLGKPVTGLLWFFTGGMFVIGQLIDLFTLGKRVDEHNAKVQLSEALFSAQIQKPSARSVEKETLAAAYTRGGILTPSVLAITSNLSIDEAEKELNRLRDKGICRMEASEKGTIEYHFPEFLK